MSINFDMDKNKLIPLSVIGTKFDECEFQVNAKDAIIHAYSLGVGRSNQIPQKETQYEEKLKYIYEGHQDFTILPTFSSIITQFAPSKFVFRHSLMPSPKKQITLLNQQCVHFHRSEIKVNGKYVSQTVCIGIIENKIPQICFRTTTKQKLSNEEFCTTFSKVALPGLRTQPFKTTHDALNINKNNQFPHFFKKPQKIGILQTIDIFIPEDQPILYRLNRITNNVHIDPKLAKQNKLDRPILHGQALIQLCIKQLLLRYKKPSQKIVGYHSKILSFSYSGNFRMKIWFQNNTYWFQLIQVNTFLTHNLNSDLSKSPQKICLVGSMKIRQFSKL